MAHSKHIQLTAGVVICNKLRRRRSRIIIRLYVIFVGRCFPGSFCFFHFSFPTKQPYNGSYSCAQIVIAIPKASVRFFPHANPRQKWIMSSLHSRARPFSSPIKPIQINSSSTNVRVEASSIKPIRVHTENSTFYVIPSSYEQLFIF